MLISEILSADCTRSAVPCSSKKRVLEIISELAAPRLGLDEQKLFDSLLAREKMGTTGIGGAIAIPHGRIPKLDKAYAAFSRLSNAIPFDAPDGQNVQLLVILLVPESATQQHLDLLAQIAQKLSDESVRHQLLTSDDPQQIYNLLSS